MSTQFVIENGLLVQKLFVGPMPLTEVNIKKHSIAKLLDNYENVNEALVMNKHLKEQQALAAATIEAEPITTERHKKKVVRRRRKFVYHAADEIINKGYWSREKRSLTKYHSNSLMFEYTQIRGDFKV